MADQRLADPSLPQIALDEAQMRALDEALVPEKVSGPRYNPTTMATIDR